MIILGIAFVIFAALVHFAQWTVPVAALIVGIGAIVLGLVMGERLERLGRP